jgi:hypothetical protein
VTPEIWALFAALLLLVAAAVRCLTPFREGSRWDRIAVAVRAAALLGLVMAVFGLAVAHGGWSPFDIGQVASGLALATLVVYLALRWRLKVDPIAPAVDLLASALALVGVFSAPSRGSVLACAQRMVPFYVQFALFLLGAGGLAVAGSAAVMLALRAALARYGKGYLGALWIDLHVFLKQSSALALVTLGAGLAVSSWWAWRTVGSLTSGVPAEGWIAAAALITAMSLLVRRVGKRWGRWAAGFAVLAAVVSVLGLLAAAGPGRFPGV